MAKVSISGMGKAGLPLAVVVAEAGHEVTGIDVNQDVVDMINRGECPITGEPGLPEMIEKYHGTNLKATTDAVPASSDTQIHVVIVPLFIDEGFQPDFSCIDSAITDIGKGLSKGDLVVLETSVPVGTTRSRLAKNLEEASGLKAGEDFHLAYSPERIMTGYSISRFKEFPKIVGGITDESTEKAYEFYSSFCNSVTRVSNSETAELAKLAEGVYRDVNIAIANELYKVSSVYGVGFWEMRDAANHEYCNIHEAGAGVGGHCIPVYPQFIIQDFKKKGLEAPLSETARNLNDGMAGHFTDIVKKHFIEQGTKPEEVKVAVVGLTFREGVDELFYTRSKTLVRLLKDAGFNVYGIDPLLSADRIETEFQAKNDDGEDMSQFDCVILVNKEPGYAKKLMGLEEKIFIVDCKNNMGKL